QPATSRSSTRTNPSQSSSTARSTTTTTSERGLTSAVTGSVPTLTWKPCFTYTRKRGSAASMSSVACSRWRSGTDVTVLCSWRATAWARSRCTTGGCPAASATPLRTFSIGFGPSQFDEARYARLVAKRFETDHHELVVEAGAPELINDIVWHYDQPFGDSSALPTFQVARITRPHVTVVLN